MRGGPRGQIAEAAPKDHLWGEGTGGKLPNHDRTLPRAAQRGLAQLRADRYPRCMSYLARISTAKRVLACPKNGRHGVAKDRIVSELRLDRVAT